MDPLHATIEEFAADGYTHVECHCPRCRMTRQANQGHLEMETGHE
jgi:phage FluMu protein Com